MKLFGGGSNSSGDEKEKDKKAKDKASRLSVHMTKASSISGFPKPHSSFNFSSGNLTKATSYSHYPTHNSSKTMTYKTFQPNKSRTLRRRESIDFSDLLKLHDLNEKQQLLQKQQRQQLRCVSPANSPQPPRYSTQRRPSEEMRKRFNCYRTLPCISSWDMYGDDTVVVTFHTRRMSTSHVNLPDFYAPEEKKIPREKIRKEDAIYEVVGDKQPVVAATKEKLLKLLVDPRSDPEYLHQYVETHIWHCSTAELLKKLVELYNPNMTSDDLNLTRLRVIGIIVHWMDHFSHDFHGNGSPELKELLMSFIDMVAKTGMPTRDLADAVAGKRRKSGTDMTLIHIGKPSKIPKKAGGESGKFQFLDFHPTEVARQLTLLEHAKFSEIKRVEFLRQAWNKNGEERAPTLVAFIKRFNQISYWVATEIVFTPNLKQRIIMVKKMIQVASKCLAFNNFNSAMEIVAGLNLSSVQRLKKTWKGLPSKYASLLHDITKLLGSESNYRQYRTILSRADPPATPYLGVFLRDLTFIEDGNPDFVEDDQFVNFEKLRMLSSVLSTIAKYQRVKFPFEVVPVIRDYIQEAMFLDDAQLHKYSQLCEPPAGATASASGMSTGTGTFGKTPKRSSIGLFT